MLKNLTQKEEATQKEKILKLIDKMEIEKTNIEYGQEVIKIYKKTNVLDQEYWLLLVTIYDKKDLIDCMDYILRRYYGQGEYRIINTKIENLCILK